MARILAVDDSQLMREMIAYTLESAGHQVSVAVDGLDALSLARGQPFELVLSDVNMPNMDGIALVAELRTMAEFRFTPILMITTERSPGTERRAKQAGATGWITKPFSPIQLVQTVNKLTE